jgi:polyhydroxybutyrate depolymerase
VVLAHGGRERSALVHVPPGPPPAAGWPLVLALHGGGSDAPQFERYAGLHRLGAKEGFAVAYPNGSGRLDDKLLTWNAGTCCGFAARENVDDTGFIAALLGVLGRRMALDARRVYVTGLSNGAMMSYRLAAELPHRIAAIMPVAGSAGVFPDPARPGARAVPVMHIHSVDDPRALFGGGLGTAFPFTSSQVLHPAVVPTLERLASVYGCTLPARTNEQREWRASVDAPMHSAARMEFRACDQGGTVVLWKLGGAGHVWPGAPEVAVRLLGPGTRVLDANEEAWTFFSKYSLPE